MSEFAIDIIEVSKVYKLYDKPIDRLKELLNFSGKKIYAKDFVALNKITLR